MSKLPSLGVLSGGGALPEQVISTCVQQGRDVFVVTFTGQPRPSKDILQQVPWKTMPLGAVSKTLKLLKEQNVEEVLFAGNLHKPSLFDLRPDGKALKLLGSLTNHHDDALLSGLSKMLEKEGFKVIAAQDILPNVLTPLGVLGKISPDKDQQQDIELGINAAKNLGALDIGQAVVVKNKVVLGVEAVEGTNDLIERCARLRGEENSGGILIKVAKPNQTKKADLPTIGPKTIDLLAKHKYAGVVVSAGSSLVLEMEKSIKQANKANIFVIGENV